MTSKSILSQIKNNLEWLEIDTTNHSINSLIKELKNNENTSLAIETIMLIKLYLGGQKNEL